jgi:hypothetical protein
MQSTLKMPFSNVQQELLQLYAHHVSDNDLNNIKELLGNYFANRLSQLADQAWHNNNWTNEDMENILNDPAQ